MCPYSKTKDTSRKLAAQTLGENHIGAQRCYECKQNYLPQLLALYEAKKKSQKRLLPLWAFIAQLYNALGSMSIFSIPGVMRKTDRPGKRLDNLCRC